MKHDPQHYAEALYLAMRDKNDTDADMAMTRFMDLMAVRGLTSLLPAVLDALPDAADRNEGIEKVSIQSARELPKKTLDDVLSALDIDPSASRIETEVRPELIGGIRIKRADSVYDATLKRRLTRLKAQINKKQV